MNYRKIFKYIIVMGELLYVYLVCFSALALLFSAMVSNILSLRKTKKKLKINESKT